MSVKRLNYLSIPLGQRRTMAKQSRLQIKMAMNNNPGMTAEDRAKYMERLAKLSQWESGTLEVLEQPSARMVGTAHNVAVSESVGVGEEAG